MGSDRALGFGVVALLVGALVLGGATQEGDMAQAAVRLMSLPLMLLALWRLSRLGPPSESTAPIVLLAATLAIPLLQLVPLPPALWEHLPGRAGFAQTYRAAQMELPWLPISLSPDGTWNALLALLPPAAVFLSVLSLDGRSRRGAAYWVLAAVTASVVLGVLQVGGGPGAFRLYEITNASGAVGFFANRNHQASLLLAAVPFAVLWVTHAQGRLGAGRIPTAVLGAALAALFLVGLIVSQSRAGLALGVIAAAGGLMMVLRAGGFGIVRRRWWVAIAVAAGVGCLLLLLAAGLQGAAGKALSEPRIFAVPAIAQTGVDHLPFGSGLGSFDPVYRMYEEPQTLTRVYLNHAHNDYLELWMETGLLGLAGVIAFLVWGLAAARRAWTTDAAAGDLARAGSLAVGLLLIHSLLDYPLRTTAMATLFAFACACLVPPLGPVERSLEAAMRPIGRKRSRPPAPTQGAS